MLIITVKQLIETLQNYPADKELLVTWWASEDVEMVMADEGIDDTERAEEIWNSINSELDEKTSDYVICPVNDELSRLVYEELEQNNDN